MREAILPAPTRLVGVNALGTGRTTVLQGIVHLVIIAAFLFLAVVPQGLSWKAATWKPGIPCATKVALWHIPGL